ncbi:MAG: HEPN domain-containing protein [Bacteroidota bacterium]
MKQITKDWLKSAEMDLSLIESINNRNNLTPLIAFHSQQVIEKSFKAIIEEFEIGFIKSHDLEMLLNKIKKYINFEIDINLFKEIDKLYIDARYPGELGLLPNGKPTIEEAKEFYNFAKEIFEKIKESLEKTNNNNDDNKIENI